MLQQTSGVGAPYAELPPGCAPSRLKKRIVRGVILTGLFAQRAVHSAKARLAYLWSSVGDALRNDTAESRKAVRRKMFFTAATLRGVRCRWRDKWEEKHPPEQRMPLGKHILSFIFGIPAKDIQYDFLTKSPGRYALAFLKRLPLMALACLALTMCVAVVTFLQQYTLAVRVLIDGREVALVQEQDSFMSIMNAVNSQVVEYGNMSYQLDVKPTYEVALARKDEYQTPNEVRMQLLSAVSGEAEDMAGLFIDGDLVAANQNTEGLQKILSSILDAYRSAEDDDSTRVEFVQDVVIEKGLLPTVYKKSLADIYSALTASEVETKYYTVLEGEVLSTIAMKLNMTTNKLLELNPEITDSSLPAGTVLRVQIPEPMLSVKTVRTVQYTEEIPFETIEIETDNLYVHSMRLKTEGQVGERTINAEVSYRNGVEVSREITSENVTKEAVNEEVLVGTKERPASMSTGLLILPLPAGSFIETSPFGYRWGRIHQGVDLGCSTGTPIYAADTGTVSFAGWNGSYGYLVIIDHADGISTWYAHCSAILVEEGALVYQGEEIALVGSTGNSTGPHLHFQYMISGEAQNPVLYLPSF